MALIKGFDPSKQFKVVKTFFDGGRKYMEGDIYDPQTALGQSKKLFRHYVAKRIVPIVEEQKVVPESVSKKEEATAGDTVQQEPVVEDNPVPKRRRKKKTEDSDES